MVAVEKGKVGAVVEALAAVEDKTVKLVSEVVFSETTVVS